MTFSIAACCEDTGMLGTAISTSSICVGSRCPWARAEAGAILTQNVTNPALGINGLDLLTGGFSAQEVLDRLLASERYPAYRQLAIIDKEGNTAHYSGEKNLGINGYLSGNNCIAAGNLLANDTIPQAMVTAFEQGAGKHLAERLMLALEAAHDAGGEAGDVHSAGLLVVDKAVWPLVDLRLDWDDAPIQKLRRLWELYEPQMMDYMTRGHNPEVAPSYGVPGDM